MLLKQALFFVLSLLGLLGFFTVTVLSKFAKFRRKKYNNTARFTLLILSGAALLFGGRYLTDFSFSIGGIQSVLESFYDSLKFFFADGTSYEQISENITEPWLKLGYVMLYYALGVIAIYCTATAVVSIFHNYASRKKLIRMGKIKNLCIFNELSEKALSIAIGIKNDADFDQEECQKHPFFTQPLSILDSKQSKRFFVFCGVDNDDCEMAKRAYEELDAICIKADFVDVHQLLREKKCYKRSDRRIFRYYLIKEDHPQNVHQAIEIASIERNEKEKFFNLMIFAFVTGDVDGLILEGLNCNQTNQSFVVRRLNPALMLAYDVIATVSQNTLVSKDNPDKDITVIIAGLSQYGLEIAKMLCWFYQRKNGKIAIHVVDSKIGLKEALMAKNPGWIDNESCDFKLVFHEGMNIYSTQFVELINSSAALDAIYISLGDDTEDTEAALYMQNVLNRRKDNNNIVKIFSLIHDDIRYKNLTEHNVSFSENINFFGWDSELYKPEYIYNYKRETKAASINSSDYQNVTNERERLYSLAKTYHDELIKFLYPDGLTIEQAEKIKQKHSDVYNLTNPKL